MTARAEQSTGEALVFLLEAYGVDTVFGIPGVHNIEMYRALPRASISHVLTRHEQGAGFMADGYARASGKPGVAFTITGPGLLNALTPLAQAWSDSSPVLVVSSALDIADSAQGRGRLHELANQRGAAASITKSSFAPMTPADVEDALAAVFAGMAADRPRPAYLELPIDLLTAAAPAMAARALPGRPMPDPARIEQAARLLDGARQPVIWLGGGAVGGAAAARTLAERVGAIVVTTVAGKGIVPESHELSLGARLPQPEVQALVRAADVVLAVGTEAAETDLWASNFRFGGAVIRVDLDPVSVARPHAATIAIRADAAASLAALAAAVPADVTGRRAESAARVAAILAGEADREIPLRRSLRPVIAALRAALPEDTIVASDMTQIAYAANELFPVEQPRCWLHPVGFGTLGFALPAAIGAKAALPRRPVVALAGDYGFQYTLNELGTAAELGQNLPVLLWNNEALAEIHDSMTRAGIQPNAVTARNPDFQALARAYRCHAARPTTLEDLEPAIAAALAADRPTLIEMTPEMARR